MLLPYTVKQFNDTPTQTRALQDHLQSRDAFVCLGIDEIIHHAVAVNGLFRQQKCRKSTYKVFVRRQQPLYLTVQLQTHHKTSGIQPVIKM